MSDAALAALNRTSNLVTSLLVVFFELIDALGWAFGVSSVLVAVTLTGVAWLVATLSTSGLDVPVPKQGPSRTKN